MIWNSDESYDFYWEQIQKLPLTDLQKAAIRNNCLDVIQASDEKRSARLSFSSEQIRNILTVFFSSISLVIASFFVSPVASIMLALLSLVLTGLVFYRTLREETTQITFKQMQENARIEEYVLTLHEFVELSNEFSVYKTHEEAYNKFMMDLRNIRTGQARIVFERSQQQSVVSIPRNIDVSRLILADEEIKEQRNDLDGIMAKDVDEANNDE